MTRTEIINSLIHGREIDLDILNERLQTCNVRVCRVDGSIKPNTEIKQRWHIVDAMQADETIARVEYRFDQKWQLAY